MSAVTYSLERNVVNTKQIFRLKGAVVEGFQRGSRLLGYPTANLDPNAFKHVLTDTPRGVYCGWASIGKGPVYKAVLSLGYNPHFKNEEETVEVYLMHKFDDMFYGAEMRLLICGFLRPQWEFKDGMDQLITAIQTDEKASDVALATTYSALQHDPIFEGCGDTGDSEGAPTPVPEPATTTPKPDSAAL